MQLTDKDKEMIRDRVAAMKRRWFPEAFPLKDSTVTVLEIIERFWAECSYVNRATTEVREHCSVQQLPT